MSLTYEPGTAAHFCEVVVLKLASSTFGIVQFFARDQQMKKKRSNCGVQNSHLTPRYRGTSLVKKRTPLGPYRRHMPRVLGEWTLSYERGTPVVGSHGGGDSC